jgi:hypothetical protein
VWDLVGKAPRTVHLSINYSRAGKPIARVPKLARQKIFLAYGIHCCPSIFPHQPYRGRKITDVTVRGEKVGKSKRGARLSTVCLSMYSITENIYYSQLYSVAILLQPERVSHRIIQRKHCVLSLCVLSSCCLPLLKCLLPTANEARCYFASTILWRMYICMCRGEASM